MPLRLLQITKMPAVNPRAVFGCICNAILLCGITSTAVAEESLSFDNDVAPILTTYCSGCHNDSGKEGEFSVSSLSSLLTGAADGKVVVAEDPKGSRLMQVLLSSGDDRMPPEDEPAPSDENIQTICAWINQGKFEQQLDRQAKMALATSREVPKLPPADISHQYVGSAVAVSDGLVVGRLGRVEMFPFAAGEPAWATNGLAGKVNSLNSSHNARWIVASGGISGVGGQVTLLDRANGEVLKQFVGHTDSVYCAQLSPDGRWLASGGYDRRVILWDVETGEQVRELSGHNGAIYDLSFDPSSEVLATASADQTIKLWRVDSGERLDTFAQPEGAMHCVLFSPDGKFVFAAGADKQIRKWQVVSRERPAINPMLVARYAHESGVLQLELSQDGYLLSASDDGTVKLWGAEQLEPLGEVANLDDFPVALSSIAGERIAAVVVELDGSRQDITSESIRSLIDHANRPAQVISNQALEYASALPGAEENAMKELEPNNALAAANAIVLPAKIEGKINVGDSSSSESDVDFYRFSAKRGQPWIVEVNAASQGSELDSQIDILDASGQPVIRTRLQATQESYFTFRGKDGATSDDFRLHKWEDMELDQYLYSSGEVNRLWLYPRGPDSGFKVYPGTGDRYTFFDTTPVTHALGEPAYVVRELGYDEQPLPNGLPIFPVYFENDDDGLRRAGKDSRLTFVAPADGEYLLRVRDARGFGGDNFGYEVHVRSPKPDFSLTVQGNKMEMPVGSGREWKVEATRLDGLSGPIEVALHGLPEGFVATNPLMIEAGQNSALGTVFATADAAKHFESSALPDEKASEAGGENAKSPSEAPKLSVKMIARSTTHDGQELVHELDTELELSITDSKEVQLVLHASSDGQAEVDELVIRPGETVSALVKVERNGTESRISFGKEDSGRNLPHGVYVDNIGLSGLLITEVQNEREFFITAAKKVQPGRWQFHLRSETTNNPTSRPIWLTVLPAEDD